MTRPRFTIGGLLAIVLVAAIAAAALRAADDAWDSGLLGAVALILLVAALLAVHRDGARRAYWLGFALFGGAYFVLCMLPSVEPRLPTTKGLAYLDRKLNERQQVFSISLNVTNAAPAGAVGTIALAPTAGSTPVATTSGRFRVWNAVPYVGLAGPGGTAENFVRIGHSLLALVLAGAGGLLSRRLAAGGAGTAAPPREGGPAGDAE